MIDLFKAFQEAWCGIFPDCKKEILNQIFFWIVLVSMASIILRWLYLGVKKITLWRNQQLLNRDLHPYYSYSDVARTTRYFVPLNQQNLAPSIDKELGNNFVSVSKEPIIPLFINKAFKKGGDDDRFYLVLADSGMGKTTFLINLYLAYKNSIRFFYSPKKYEIKLFPLGFPNILDDIKKVENKENTILLLDAFDEDIEAIKDYKTRLNQILKEVHRFREIVITCRTQFFPSEDELPDKTGYMTAGERGEYRFQKSYLSVFDDNDIDKYLKKRFSTFRLKKRKRAKRIVKKSPTLVVRPMLLSHIEELVDSRREYEFSFEIYEEMIKKWIIREARKPKVSHLYVSERNATESLHNFTHNLALFLYQNRGKSNSYILQKDLGIDSSLLSMLKIPQVNSSFLEKIAKGKSLLNRDAHGNYKFSHKSILEYYLAKELFNNQDFFKIFNFKGMDACRKFIFEMINCELRKVEKLYINHKKIDNKKIASKNRENISQIKIIYNNDLVSINFLHFFSNLSNLRLVNTNKHEVLASLLICMSMLSSIPYKKMYDLINIYSPSIYFLKLIDEMKSSSNNKIIQLDSRIFIDYKDSFNYQRFFVYLLAIKRQTLSKHIISSYNYYVHLKSLSKKYRCNIFIEPHTELLIEHKPLN